MFPITWEGPGDRFDRIQISCPNALGGEGRVVRSAAIAEKALAGTADDPEFFRTKLVTARFYAENILPQTASYARMATTGAEAVMALSEDAF